METIYPKTFHLDARTSVVKVLVGEPPATLRGCANCGDRGYVFAFYAESGPYSVFRDTKDAVTYVEGEGWYIGGWRSQPCPVCQGDQRMEYLAKISGLSGRDLDIRLEHFKALPGKERAREVAGKLLSYAPAPTGFVTLHGGYGVGKTTLLKALVNGFRLAGLPSVYARLSDLLAEVREGFADNAKKAAERILESYGSARVLAIDELDKVRMTEWAQETVFRLLDGRYELSNDALTIIATNVVPTEFPPDMEYLASRIQSGIVVEVGGDDVRIAQGYRLTQRALMS